MNSKVRLYFSNKLASGIVLKLPRKSITLFKNVVRLKMGQNFFFNSQNGEMQNSFQMERFYRI